jgi:hypothetical protein
MANNFVSYNRFTRLPDNISDYGAGIDELRLAKGRPETNTAITPMAAPRRSRRLLALQAAGSDELRLDEPENPQVDPYDGPQSTLSLSRTGTQKLGGAVLGDLQGVVEAMGPSDTRSLMLDSFNRVAALRDALGDFNKMTEAITVRAIAASRG